MEGNLAEQNREKRRKKGRTGNRCGRDAENAQGGKEGKCTQCRQETRIIGGWKGWLISYPWLDNVQELEKKAYGCQRQRWAVKWHSTRAQGGIADMGKTESAVGVAAPAKSGLHFPRCSGEGELSVAESSIRGQCGLPTLSEGSMLAAWRHPQLQRFSRCCLPLTLVERMCHPALLTRYLAIEARLVLGLEAHIRPFNNVFSSADIANGSRLAHRCNATACAEPEGATRTHFED